jgi:hypothetical protein
MKRRVWLSLLCGIAFNAVFFTLSTLVDRFFPFADKPGMPNAFSWLLMPGFVVGSQFDGHRLLALAVMITVNTLIYGFVVFCLLSIIKKFLAKSH